MWTAHPVFRPSTRAAVAFGEPTVKTLAEAIAFLMNSEIDVFYIEGRRITRA